MIILAKAAHRKVVRKVNDLHQKNVGHQKEVLRAIRKEERKVVALEAIQIAAHPKENEVILETGNMFLINLDLSPAGDFHRDKRTVL